MKREDLTKTCIMILNCKKLYNNSLYGLYENISEH